MTLTPDAPRTPDSGPLTPPPAGSTPGDAAASAPLPPRRSSAKVVAILTICAGGVLILGTLATGVLSIVRAAAVHTETASIPAAGLQSLDVDVSGADITVTYGSGSDATLTVTGARGIQDWSFDRDGDRLVVNSDRDWFSRWGWFREPDRVELTLPLGSEGLDADLDVSGGSLTARGDFGELVTTLDAGALRVSGGADALTAEINAGSARIDLADVETARFSVNAGSVEGSLSAADEGSGAGATLPSSVMIDVSAGRLDLEIPDTMYALTQEVSAGSFTHDLDTSPSSDHRIGVTVSAGAVTLRAAG